MALGGSSSERKGQWWVLQQVGKPMRLVFDGFKNTMKSQFNRLVALKELRGGGIKLVKNPFFIMLKLVSMSSHPKGFTSCKYKIKTIALIETISLSYLFCILNECWKLYLWRILSKCLVFSEKSVVIKRLLVAKHWKSQTQTLPQNMADSSQKARYKFLQK